jgi:hypothetical protein
MRKNIKSMLSGVLVAAMLMTGFPAPAFAGEGTIADGEYTIGVKAWNGAQDQPSAMAETLDPVALLTVADGAYTVALRFIKSSMFGGAIPVNGNSVSEVWPEQTANEVTEGTGNPGVYNPDDESKTVTVVLSSLDMPNLALYVVPMSSVQTIRLNFDLDSLTSVGSDPEPTKLTGKAHVEQFGGYDVDVTVTVGDTGLISELEVVGSNFSGTYADYNKNTVFLPVVQEITQRFIGLSIDDAAAISGVDVVSGAT